MYTRTSFTDMKAREVGRQDKQAERQGPKVKEQEKEERQVETGEQGQTAQQREREGGTFKKVVAVIFSPV